MANVLLDAVRNAEVPDDTSWNASGAYDDLVPFGNRLAKRSYVEDLAKRSQNFLEDQVAAGGPTEW